MPSISDEHRSSTLNDLVLEIGEFIAKRESKSLHTAWKELYTSLHRSDFTIVIAGDARRGKSTLINTLLDQALLPTGSSSPKGLCTKIVDGNPPRLKYREASGQTRHVPISTAAWEELRVHNEEMCTVPLVEVTISDAWLHDNHCVLVDTPGPADLAGTISAIAGCDVALFAIAATSAASEWEQLFIDQFILSRKVPVVAIVLTRLDQVIATERMSVVDYICNLATEWDKQIPVLICNSDLLHSEDEPGVIVGVNAIKDWISSWSRDERLKGLKFLSLFVSLTDLLQLVVEGLWQEKSELTISNDDRKKLLKQATDGIEHLSLTWEDLRLKMEAKANQCKQLIQNKISQAKVELIEQLKMEISHSNHPKQYWEKELPPRLQHQLNNLAKQLEQLIQKMLYEDWQWLNEQCTQEFAQTIRTDRPVQVVSEMDAASAPFTQKLKDLNRSRMISRTITGAATIVSYLALGPFGIAASIGGGIIYDNKVTQDLAKQKDQLTHAVYNKIHTILEKSMQESLLQVDLFYEELIFSARTKEILWRTAKQEQLKKDPLYQLNDVAGIDQQIAQVHSFITVIQKMETEEL